MFPYVSRLISNHCLIILDLSIFKWGPTPLKYENMWLRHEVKTTVEYEWNQITSSWLARLFDDAKVETFERKLKRWNKDVFGCVKEKKDGLVGRIHELYLMEENHQNLTEEMRCKKREENLKGT